MRTLHLEAGVVLLQHQKGSEALELALAYHSARTPAPTLHKELQRGTEPGCPACSHLLEHLAVLVGKDTKSASNPLHAGAQQRLHVDICHAVGENLPVLISLETQIEALRY